MKSEFRTYKRWSSVMLNCVAELPIDMYAYTLKPVLRLKSENCS
jgi:hypothetical protein